MTSLLRWRRTLLLRELETLSKLVGRPLSGVVARVEGGPEEDNQLLLEMLGENDPAIVELDDEGTADSVEDVDEAEGGLTGEG